MRDRLAQNSAREQAEIAEGVCLVDKQQLQLPAQGQVLEAVVEHEGVGAEFRYCVVPRAYAVFVYNYNYPGEVAGEHVGFVAREFGVEQNPLAVGDHFRLGGFAVGEPSDEFFQRTVRLAFIAAA